MLHTCTAEPCRRSPCGEAWLPFEVRRCAGDACRLPGRLPPPTAVAPGQQTPS